MGWQTLNGKEWPGRWKLPKGIGLSVLAGWINQRSVCEFTGLGRVLTRRNRRKLLARVVCHLRCSVACTRRRERGQVKASGSPPRRCWLREGAGLSSCPRGGSASPSDFTGPMALSMDWRWEITLKKDVISAMQYNSVKDIHTYCFR